MKTIEITSIEKYYKNILEYIFFLNEQDINNFKYLEEYLYYNYKFSHKIEKDIKRKVLIPNEKQLKIKYKEYTIDYSYNLITPSLIADGAWTKSNSENTDTSLCKLLTTDRCGNSSEKILYIIRISHTDKDVLINFIDDAKEYCNKIKEEFTYNLSEYTRIYLYNDYWSIFSKKPKRNKDTIYLNEGTLEKIEDSITNFYSESNKLEYLQLGIPYKHVYLFYGIPGSGKTSTIHYLASKFNSDIFILPLSSEFTDSQFLDAVGGIFKGDNEKSQNTRKILVIEDIDCIFEDRKEGDMNRCKLSLNNILNCLDGFTCLDGTIMILTANSVNAFDDALIRSCRIDTKVEFTYADKYQTYLIMNKYIPNKVEIHDKLYKLIQHKKYSIAMLQEFLFKYRKCNNIEEYFNELLDIINQNIKKTDKNLYI